jgi:hypothetical protein
MLLAVLESGLPQAKQNSACGRLAAPHVSQNNGEEIIAAKALARFI